MSAYPIHLGESALNSPILCWNLSDLLPQQIQPILPDDMGFHLPLGVVHQSVLVPRVEDDPIREEERDESLPHSNIVDLVVGQEKALRVDQSLTVQAWGDLVTEDAL